MDHTLPPGYEISGAQLRELRAVADEVRRTGTPIRRRLNRRTGQMERVVSAAAQRRRLNALLADVGGGLLRRRS